MSKPTQPINPLDGSGAVAHAFAACRTLVAAYETGAEDGGSTDWDSIDCAWEFARDALRKLEPPA